MRLPVQSPSAHRCRARLSLVLAAGLALLTGASLPATVAAMPPAKTGASKPSCKAKGKQTGKSGKRQCKSCRKQRRRAPTRRRHVERRVPALKGKQPNVQSLGALVVDMETGQELFARKPDVPRAIASLSKLAAVLAVMDRSPDLEGLTTIKKVDAEVARGGARSRLLEGLILSNRDLLHAALLGSDNRAVPALGRAVGLSSAQLTAAMNRKVAALGLRHTRFREPTGLSSDNVSTPRESIALLKAAIAHPVLGPILRRLEYDAHPVSKPPIHYINTHRPAARSNVQVVGGKTGYNDTARYCLVLIAEIAERTYGMALLGTEGELTRFGDVARVADWIVAHKPKSAPAAPSPSTPSPEAILGTSLDAASPDRR